MASVVVDGVELAYELIGPPGRPVVLFVNGLLTDRSSWDAHLPSFTDHYRCLTYDCRGQGRSAKPRGPYPTRRHAADLLGLLEALGIERVSAVGLSNGGAALLIAAARAPDRFEALVVCGAYPRADAILRAKLRSWLRAMEAGGPGLRFDVATPWVWSGQFLEEHEATLSAFRDRALTIPERAAADLIEGAMDHDVSRELSGIRAPTLVLVGEQDVLTPPWLGRAIAAAIPLARLEVLPGLGHAAALEAPEVFARRARSFLDEVRLEAR